MTPPPLRPFDMRALAAAIEAARLERKLTWAELAGEINIPFQGTPSLPIAVSTIKGITNKCSVTSGVILQILWWLGRTPESFLAGSTSGSDRDESLPDRGPSRVLRFDTRAIHAALDEERRKRGLTWKQLAAELPGFSENMLTNLATGPLIGFPRVMTLTQWLGRPAASFVRIRSR